MSDDTDIPVPAEGGEGKPSDPLTEAQPEAQPDGAQPDGAQPDAVPPAFKGEYIVVEAIPQPAPMIHLPDAESTDESIRRIATANTAARDASAAQLDEWFPGYSFVDAAQTSDDRRFTVLNLGSALFEHLDGIETVERILSQQHLVGGSLRFSHGEHKRAEPSNVIDQRNPGLRRTNVGPLVNALDNQWTTILNSIDGSDPASGAMCEHIERVAGARVNVNVYISYGHALGFGQHWDNHDTIIVPAAGTKKWRVFEPATLSPQRPWVGPEVSNRPVWEGSIEPGMCLVIPRGWGHEVQGSDDLSIHYTIGINRLTFADVLQRIAIESGFNPLIRADVAYDLTTPVQSYAGSLHDDPSALPDLLAELATPELITRAIATFRSRCPMRLSPRLFDMWAAACGGDWDAMTVRMPVPMGLHLVGVGERATQFAIGNMRLTAAAAATDLIISLADVQAHLVADLPLVNDDAAQREKVCSELLRAGLIDARYR